jgi:hypothetical protein
LSIEAERARLYVRLYGPTSAGHEFALTQLRDVNTTDIRAGIRLGCRTMQSVFNADDNFVPFFGSTVWPEAALWFSPDLSECHVPGRHLNALLEAEAVAGVEVDPVAIEHLRRAAFFSFSGPVRLPLNRQVIDGPLVNFSPHNLREAMHALNALVTYRQDDEARALAEAFLAEINSFWQPGHVWDVARFKALGLTYLATQGPLNGETRMIGPLVKYYRATRYAPALEMALRLKEEAVERFFLPDGIYDHARFITDHTHSITSSMSSLAQLGDFLGDMALLERVRAFYERGLWEMRDEIGWGPTGVFARNTDQGEASVGGDIVETALILGRHGYTQCLGDAERIVRSHLLPCQLRDVSFMRDAANPDGKDGLRDAANRHLGAWGLPAPYGHLAAGNEKTSIGFYMDIVGSVTGSLCAAERSATRWAGGAHWMDLLFDHDSPHLHVWSPYGGGPLRIELKHAGPLFVRRPAWLNPQEVVVANSPGRWRWVNDYLFVAQPPVGSPIEVRFPLPETSLTLSERVHSHPIRVRLRGDSPLAMDNFGTDLTFFEAYD